MPFMATPQLPAVCDTLAAEDTRTAVGSRCSEASRLAAVHRPAGDAVCHSCGVPDAVTPADAADRGRTAERHCAAPSHTVVSPSQLADVTATEPAPPRMRRAVDGAASGHAR